MKWLVALSAFLTVVVVGTVVLVTVHNNSHAPGWSKPAPYLKARSVHAVGGAVSVAVSTPPEVGDTGEGGDAVRALTVPHLFVASPDGNWMPSLAQPGSDGATNDALTAWFKLRPNVKWSDGTLITVDDLRRTVDARFVKGIDGPDKNGRITVHFKNPLPGWRSLWSGVDGIASARADVYAGPFFVQTVVSGADTTLVRNPNWFAPAFLNSIQLDYVPDSSMARRLVGAKQVDVVQPVGDSVRSTRFGSLPGIKVSMSDGGGRWVGLRFNATGLNATNASALSAFPREAFVNSLLAGEAAPLNGFVDKDNTWLGYGGKTNVDLSAVNATITVPAEDPLSSLVASSLQRAMQAGKGTLQIRSATASQTSQLIGAATYDVAMVSGVDGPSKCWTCSFGAVDPHLAQLADSGDTGAAVALERKLRDDGIFEPLWRERTDVAYVNSAVNGIAANGYNPSVVWNAEDWWRS